MYAVLDDRNQQYRVAAGDRIKIHLRSDSSEGDSVTFDKVCVVGGSDGAGRVGTPHVAGVTVTGTVVRHVKDKKVIIGHFRRRKNSRKRNGFRAQYTMVQIEAING